MKDVKEQHLAIIADVGSGGMRRRWTQLGMAGVIAVIAVIAMLGFGYGAAYASVADPAGGGDAGDGAVPQALPWGSSYDPEDPSALGEPSLFFPAIKTDKNAVSAAPGFNVQDIPDDAPACYTQSLIRGDGVPRAQVYSPPDGSTLILSAYYFELKDKYPPNETVDLAFCIQPLNKLNNEEPSYCEGDGSEISGRVAWLLNTYPPIKEGSPALVAGEHPGCDAAGMLECRQIVQNVARQLALWSEVADPVLPRFPDVSNINQSIGTGPTAGDLYDEAVTNVYNEILLSIPDPLPLAYLPGDVTFEITPAAETNTLPGGEAHEFIVKLSKEGQPFVGTTVNVTTDFGLFENGTTADAKPTDANGEAKFVVSSAVAGTANLTARATLVVPAAKNYYNDPSSGTSSTQQTGSGGTEEVEFEATATKTWEQPLVCGVSLIKSCSIESLPPVTEDLVCTSAVAATTLRYTGAEIADAKVEIFLHKGKTPIAAAESVDLTPNLVLTLPGQNGWTIDGRSSKTRALNPKITIKITAPGHSSSEVIHTSCSQPYVAGSPAPLDGSGNPSPTWTVVSFLNKGNSTVVNEPVQNITPTLADTCTVESTGPGWSGANVTYYYQIANTLGDEVTISSVDDDKLGAVPGSFPLTLATGEATTLELKTKIFETTENNATVYGVLADGAICTDEASATVIVNVPPPPPGGNGIEGCTPGYWKQEHHFDSWVGYAPGDFFDDVFGVGPNVTLLQALRSGGGGAKALGRHAVAALLDASNADVDYAFSVAEVITAVQGAYASGDFETTKDLLEKENERGCPLN